MTARTRIGLCLGLAVLVLTGAALTPAQESPTVVRLQQEVANLRFQLDYETQQLEQRLLTLERQISQQSAAVPMPGAPMPSLPPSPPREEVDEITVRRLVLTDERGVVRGVLAGSGQFGPLLSLIDSAGNVAVMLSAAPEGSRLELFDARARRRVLIGVDGDDAVIESFPDDDPAQQR